MAPLADHPMPEPIPAPRKTPLNAWHRARGASLTVTAGWELPLAFGDPVAEHLAVRQSGAVFDLCHLGQQELAGRDAAATLQRITCNDVARLGIGEKQASVLTTPAGTVVDQVAVQRLGGAHFLLVIDAARLAADAAWVTGQVQPGDDVVVLDTSSRYAGMAIEGPAARDVLQGLTSLPLDSLPPDAVAHGEVASVRVTLSRASRTGEEGFEVLAPPQGVVKLWTAVLEEGEPDGVVPAGLAALDTLRLEAGIPLCGVDIDQAMTPLEAGLDDLVAWDKGAFLGREALAAQRTCGPARRMAGIELIDPVRPSAGQAVLVNGSPVAALTSAGQAPFLRKAVGLACLPSVHAAPDTWCAVDIGGRPARARVARLPFYRRQER
jgi:aminomethyltransferase